MRATASRGLGAALFSCVLLLAIGCNVERDPNRASGGDHLRTTAIEMPLNQIVIDHVDVVGGDRDDWKFFTINSTGLAKIQANFDNPDAEAQIFVINAVGQELSDLDLPESTESLRQLQFRADPGNYYMHIFSDELSTDYTVMVTFKEL